MTSRSIVLAAMVFPPALSILPTQLAAAPAINYSDFTSVAGLQLNGTAAQNATSVRLTNSAEMQAASVFVTTPQDVTHDFSMTYSFTITSPGDNGFAALNGVQYGPNGADGLAFVITGDTRGSSSLGEAGGELGYGHFVSSNNPIAIQHSLAVALRTYVYNRIDLFDDLANPNLSISYQSTPIATQTGTLPAIIGIPQTVNVSYVAATDQLTVLLNGNSIGLDNVTLPAPLSSIVDGNAGYFGFTAATGGAWSTIDLSSFTATGVPEPASLTLLVLGGGALLMRRRKLAHRHRSSEVIPR